MFIVLYDAFYIYVHDVFCGGNEHAIQHCINMMAMSMLFNTETLAKGERLQGVVKRIISLTNTTVDMELSLNAHRNEKCGSKLHIQTS